MKKCSIMLRENLPFDQLIWEFGTDERPDWVHVSYKKGGPQRGQILAVRETQKGKRITLINSNDIV